MDHEISSPHIQDPNHYSILSSSDPSLYRTLFSNLYLGLQIYLVLIGSRNKYLNYPPPI